MATIAYPAALYLRVGDGMFDRWYGALEAGWPLWVAIAAVSFLASRLYRGVWRYASLQDLWAVTQAVTIAVLAFVPALFLVNRLEALPRSVPLILGLLLLVLLGGPRFLYRVAKDRRMDRKRAAQRIPVLLIGAGDGAELFIRAMQNDPLAPYEPVGVIDDLGRRVGRDIHGVRVLGTASDLERVARDLGDKGKAPQRLIVTRVNAPIEGPVLRELFDAADRLGMTLARMPSLADLDESNGENRIKLRPIAIEDLLGRPQVLHDEEAVRGLVKGKRVLITGAGGTIGSELCRQLANFGPAKMALLENGEFNLYAIEMELAERPDAPVLTPWLADVRDAARLKQIFETERPELVFHAAALKHVPLVESNPAEGVLTNIIGSRNVADAARAIGARAMVQISTDKAVRPSSIMGACKRVAEEYCQSLDLDSDTRFVTVRFGNVLGSTGSVVPRFEQQLAKGGPITVTHPDVERYFMTCREAVQLVLQASAYGVTHTERRGRILVLDMGEPVKIVDLARRMILLAGLRPDRDIRIEFTGLRPGEKLSERLFNDAEPPERTEEAGIFVAPNQARSRQAITDFVTSLERAARAEKDDDVRRLIGTVLGT
ncbi:polysaccharide biosynthesis protein CapD [Rhodospirillales bacterium TMPK1]|uniref:Polysaccharide biosynthesis protein CapD n=2 Tax=Roseiterribacter gracilis TaxID=2812848 RepID=A0A8S8XLS8_9PROT|nr:polysaccharide biosynthesis protein CapD [Rhodospirillales bacterium TMPK1]